MSLSDGEIIAQAGLPEDSRAAKVYARVLHGFASCTVTPEAIHSPAERRRVLSSLGDMPAAALAVLMGLLELEIRGLGRTNSDLTEYFGLSSSFKLSNISAEITRARRHARYQMELRPCEQACYLLPEHDTKKHRPYEIGFTLRDIFWPSEHWWRPQGGARGVPILGTVLRLNDETVLVLQQKEHITGFDRLRVVLNFLGLPIQLPPEAPFSLALPPGPCQVLASNIVYVSNTGDNSALTVRPHMHEPLHFLWNIAEMGAADSETFMDLRAVFQSLQNTSLSGLVAAPEEYEVQKIFLLRHDRSSERVSCRKELPLRLKDLIVTFPGCHSEWNAVTDSILRPLNRWPEMHAVLYEATDEPYARLANCARVANYIAKSCNLDTSTTPLISHVVAALRRGQRVAILLPEFALAHWLGQDDFRCALKHPGRAVNIMSCGGQTACNLGVAPALREILKAAAGNRTIEVTYFPSPIDRSIALFENGSVRQELTPSAQTTENGAGRT